MSAVVCLRRHQTGTAHLPCKQALLHCGCGCLYNDHLQEFQSHIECLCSVWCSAAMVIHPLHVVMQGC